QRPVLREPHLPAVNGESAGGDQFDDGGAVLRSEFAAVRVTVDRNANGDRLRIEDLRSGRSFHLDPLELERLTTIRHEDLTYVVSPDRIEWDADDAPGPAAEIE